jgi:hypothetical protein
MPSKQTLCPPTKCDVNSLESLLAVLAVRGFLSRNQIKTIANACAIYLPCDVEIFQRMPKGTTYLSINGAPMYEINNRSKLTLVSENT